MRCMYCNYDLAGLPSMAGQPICPECGRTTEAVESFACTWLQILMLLAGVIGPWLPVSLFALYFGPEWLDWQSGIVLRWLAPIAAGISMVSTITVVRLTQRGAVRRKHILRFMLVFGSVLNAAMVGLAFLWSVVLVGMGC